MSGAAAVQEHRSAARAPARKRVVLIAYSYPPDPIVGAFRPAKLVAALRAAGHEVEVITARLPGETARLRVEEPGLRVHAIGHLPHPRHLYLHLKARLRRGGAATAGAAAPPTPAQAYAPPSAAASPARWKRYLLSLLRLPDDKQGFIPAAVRAALPLLRDGADLLYTTAPPFSAHLAGLLLKRLTGVRWVAEFRDPWADNPRRPAAVRSAAADALNRRLEARCLAHADHVVAVSEFTHARLSTRLGERAARQLSLVLNGIDHIEPPAAPAPAGRPLRILHAGSLNRDAQPFLAALAAVRARLGLPAGALQVEFLGRYGMLASPPLAELARRHGLEDAVVVTPWAEQAVAHQRIREADLLLLFFDGYAEAIPYKLFDYLGARKPILAVVDAHGEAAAMLRQVGGHFVVPANEAGAIEPLLEDALRSARAGAAAGDDCLLQAWSTRAQMQKLLAALQM